MTRRRAITNPAGYVLVYHPEHPRADKGNGRVLEHILVAERALGKPLPEGSQVHHVNGDPADNRPENLVICEDQAYHSLLHRRTRALEACGHADWLCCGYCGEYSAPEDVQVFEVGNRLHVRHRQCFREHQRSQYVRSRRSGEPFSPEETEKAAAWTERGWSTRRIARALGRSKSGVQRALKRQGAAP